MRRIDPRRVKIHFNYTVEEAARLLGVHKNTVRTWIQNGLPTSDLRRPTLILGRQLAAFLHRRRFSNKRRCQPGQLYCVRCRAPKYPAADMADYVPVSGAWGQLRGLCPDCETLMHRRVSLANLPIVAAGLEVAVAKAKQRITDSAPPSLNSDFNEVA